MTAIRSTAVRSGDLLWYAIAAVLVVSGLVHLGVAAASDRAWEGPLSWRKPATFGLSFGITLATVAWTSGYLGLRERTRTALLGVLAIDCVVEVTGITLQAWRDVPSHFNTSTPFDSVVAFTLAAGGAVLILVLGRLTVATFRTPAHDAPMRLALRAGYLLLAAGLGAGAAMIARGTVLVRTGHPAEGYADGGFLKAFHGVTIHAVLVLPLLALVLDRYTALTERRSTRVVAVGVVGYVVVAAAVLAYSVAVAVS